MFLVGGGDKTKLECQATELGIRDKVEFLGERSDVPDLCNMFDFFLFPSRFEGFPVSLVEVQTNGIPTLVSDVITQQVKINDNYESLSLNDSPIKWADKILELKQEERMDTTIVKKNLVEKGFDIYTETKRVESLLLK